MTPPRGRSSEEYNECSAILCNKENVHKYTIYKYYMMYQQQTNFRTSLEHNPFSYRGLAEIYNASVDLLNIHVEHIASIRAWTVCN